jgi:hypothetical protein
MNQDDTIIVENIEYKYCYVCCKYYATSTDHKNNSVHKAILFKLSVEKQYGFH